MSDYSIEAARSLIPSGPAAFVRVCLYADPYTHSLFPPSPMWTKGGRHFRLMIYEQVTTRSMDGYLFECDINGIIKDLSSPIISISSNGKKESWEDVFYEYLDRYGFPIPSDIRGEKQQLTKERNEWKE